MRYYKYIPRKQTMSSDCKITGTKNQNLPCETTEHKLECAYAQRKVD